MAGTRNCPSALVPQGTGLTNLDEMLLKSVRLELAYHMGEFQRTGDEWHRAKVKAYRIIVQSLQTKEVDNAASS